MRVKPSFWQDLESAEYLKSSFEDYPRAVLQHLLVEFPHSPGYRRQKDDVSHWHQGTEEEANKVYPPHLFF